MFKRYSKLILTLVMVLSMIVCSSTIQCDSQAAAKAKLSVKKLSIKIGKKTTVRIKNKNSRYRYTFASGNKKIARVSANGSVTGIKAGTTKIAVKEINRKTKKKRTLGNVKIVVGKIADNKQTSAPKIITSPDTSINAYIPTQAPAVTTKPSAVPPSPSPTVYVEINFADGDISKFSAQGDGVKISLDTNGYDDNACLKATGRGQRNNWSGCGMALDVSKYLKAGRTYSVSCRVRCSQPGDVTMRSINNSGGGGWDSWPKEVGETVNIIGGQWSEYSTIYASPDSISGKLLLFWDISNTADLYIDNIVITDKQVLDDSFKSLFTDVFGKVGTCNTYSDMKNNKLFTTTLFNSVTMENETKPQALLSKVANTNSLMTSNTLPEGFVLPDSYKDSTYPVLDFTTIDQVINTAYEYGLSIRFHVLVWHAQTPAGFFKKNYDEKSSYVTKEYMDGRLEYYIRNVIKHIYETPHGKDVVYCWDVANEYFHNYDNGNKSMWNSVYYPEETSEKNRTNQPEYIKTAFKVAHDELETLGLAGKIKLFYNDYNTYEVYQDIITMVNYINEDGKICDGVGMQSHLDVDYPKPGMTGSIAAAIDAFTAQGYEIQITELDVTDYNNIGRQDSYYTELMSMLVAKKKAGANITSLTFWGLSDKNSWRGDGKPLLFKAIFVPKNTFYNVIDTVNKLWY